MRTILIYCFAALTAVGARMLHAQETPGKRLAGVVSVALSEYRLGVSPSGSITAQAELDEARAFFAEARDVARRVRGNNARVVGVLVDSLATAVNAARGTTFVDSLYARLVTALGDDAVLDRATRDADLNAGHALYKTHCAQCHGTNGFGDGAAAHGLTPPPAALAGDSARDVSPSLMYRVLSVGVKGTAMPSWSDSLTADERWDVVAYVGALRAGDGNADVGMSRNLVRSARAAESGVTRYLDAALAALRAGRTADASDGAFDAYAAFEPIESAIRPRDPGLVTRMEGEFLRFHGAVKRGDTSAAIAARDAVLADLPRAISRATPPTSRSEAFAMTSLIILREGFEAILIIGAIVGMLIRTGSGARVREVWIGALVGVVASVVTAFALQATLRSINVNPEVLEGATLLLAVIVLFSVSYWILSKIEADRWQAYVRQKVEAAVGRGGRVALMTVAFLVVYREGAETVLFFQPLLQGGSQTVPAILAGLVVGGLALAVIYVLVNRFGVRLPLRVFFGVTGGLLYAMAMVFMGKGLRELQEGGVLPNTPLTLPTIDAIGIYPSIETIAGQAVLLLLFAFACWFSFLRPVVARPRRSRGGRG